MRLRHTSLLLLWTAAACTRLGPAAPPEKKAALLSDDFNRAELGPGWRVTAAPGVYRIHNGELVVKGARNHPAWFTQALPRDAVIEIDAWSMDPAGDIKVEVYGDGKSFATSLEYTSSGYVFIQGGWRNQLSALCRMEEHGHDRRVRNDLKVEPGRRYHWTIARHGNQVDWFVDGKPALSMEDPEPLTGPTHSYFAVDNWETELHFDNLVIRPY